MYLSQCGDPCCPNKRRLEELESQLAEIMQNVSSALEKLNSYHEDNKLVSDARANLRDALYNHG